MDGVIQVHVDGKAVALANAGGQLYAVADTCTHEEASLSDGDIIGTSIECPMHGGRFDLATGAVKALPPVIPVQVYDVRVEGDDVYVREP